MHKIISLLIALVLFLNLSCREKSKSNTTRLNENEKMSTDLNDLDFNDDLKQIVETAKFDLGESEFSEYLMAYSTKQVQSFHLGDFTFNSEYEINGVAAPNESYVSFVIDDESNKRILTAHVEYNFIGDQNQVLNHLKKQFGEPAIMNDEDSVNTFKGIQNFIWNNFQENKSLLLSQFSEGGAVQLNNNKSEKIFTTLLYIVDNDAIINYPNGQQENILERLSNRFSQ